MVKVDITPTEAPAPLPSPSQSAAVVEDSANWASEFLNNKAQLPLSGFDFKTLYLFTYLLCALLLFCYVSFKLYRACQRNVLKKRLKAE